MTFKKIEPAHYNSLLRLA